MRWWLLVGLVGCGKGKVDGTAFEPNPLPGSGTVTYSTKAEGEAFVRFGLSETELDQESPRVNAGEPVELRGLVLGKKHFAEVVVGEHVSDVFEFTVDPPPDGIPILKQNAWTADQSCLDGGYVLFNYLGNQKSGVAIVDRLGRYVWAVASETPEQVGRARPGRDGQSIVWNIAHEFKAADIATIVRQPIDGSAPTVTRTLNGHHDFVELPDGDMAWLAYDIRRAPHPDGSGDVCIAAEALYEGPEGMTEAETPTTLWSTWEDYEPGVHTLTEDGGDYDSTPPKGFLKNYPCDDPPGTFPLEFQHANSMAYVDGEDAFYAYWRWLDTMVKYERTGPLAWEWGGPFSTLTNPTHEHAHFSDVWSGGMLLVDNRNPQDLSRWVEYTWDGTTFAETWSLELGHFEKLLGDVQRMPIEGCDNLLGSFSDQGRIVEMTREGEVVWEVGTSLGNVVGRVYFLPDLYDFSGVAYPE